MQGSTHRRVGGDRVRAITPSRQGRGLATAAARWFIHRARQAGVQVVLAHTLAEPNASTGVLSRCGFIRTGELADDELGAPVWRWDLDLRADRPAGTAGPRYG